MGVTSNGPDETRTVERLAYSPAEAARALGLARSSLYAALTRGDLRSVLVGGRRLVPRSEIDRILTVDPLVETGRKGTAWLEAQADEPFPPSSPQRVTALASRRLIDQLAPEVLRPPDPNLRERPGGTEIEPEAVGDRLAITPGEECVTDT